MTCDKCGRIGKPDERIGDTCGYPVQRRFRVKSDEDMAAEIKRFRRGEGSDITNPRCLGTLQHWEHDGL